jgi:microcompartment protein CcmL/EutN
MKNLTIKVLLLFWAFHMISCQQSQNRPLNPNGDSELALLMRAMYEDGERMKEHLESGKIPKPMADVEALLTAEATEPDKVATQEYKAFAESYIALTASLKEADAESAPELYKNMVDMCMTCHKSMCPGPMVRIEKLYTDLVIFK